MPRDFQHSPQVNIQDKQGRTPLYEAVTRWEFNKKAFRLMVEAGGEL